MPVKFIQIQAIPSQEPTWEVQVQILIRAMEACWVSLGHSYYSQPR